MPVLFCFEYLKRLFVYHWLAKSFLFSCNIFRGYSCIQFLRIVVVCVFENLWQISPIFFNFLERLSWVLMYVVSK